jgi:general secretion pathway protein D
VHQVRWPFLLPVAALLAATPSRAQTDANGRPQAQAPAPIRPGVRPPSAAQQPPRPAGPARPQPPAATRAQPPPPATRPQPAPAPAAPTATRATEPGEIPQVDKSEIHNNARTVMMSFDKRDLTEVIQFVSQFTQRNFILPERVSGKITILSNTPIPADDVWNVFVAALDANNWAVYPVGKYWKLTEKKQSSRSNIPVYIESGQEPPANEQMVTKLFKLHYVEADQMRNVLNQFTSRDSDFQIFPPDALIISDVGLNMRRLEKLIDQLDQPGGSEEIHIVSVQYAGAQELAQKLTEIFQSQTPAQKGVPRQLGVAQPVQPGQPVGVPQPGLEASAGGALQVGKIIPEERTNKLIVIAGGKSFDRVLDLIKQLDVPSSEGGVHVYYLENAKAEEVAATMQALAQGVSSQRRSGPAVGAPAGVPPGGAAAGPASADLFSGQVKITADKNTNSLVVIASQADYRNLVKVVERLDIRRRQVFVEAVIMEVNLSNTLDLGVSAHGGTVLNDVSFRGTKGDAPLVIGSELGGLNSIGGVATLGSLGGFLAGLQGPPLTVPGTNLSLPSFAILLNALQSSSDVNVISTPHVIMSDNTEGEITVGQNVPFQAGFSPGSLGGLSSVAGTQTPGQTGTNPALNTTSLLGLGGLGSLFAPIQRQNVELRLRIKPQINESDYVRLEVDEQTEEIASVDKTLGPTTSKRTAKTTVVAKDQETVVIGGLIQDRTTKSVQKVPVLGSLPVLGWLFRNESTVRQKTNLLLFLTPYIIRDQSDYRRIFERKMSERAEFVKRFYGEEAQYTAAVDYDRKPGPLSRVRRGVTEELSKFENGGSGGDNERVIGPGQRYSPAQMDQGGAPPASPSPAPLPAEPKHEPAPGTQAPAAEPSPQEHKPDSGG